MDAYYQEYHWPVEYYAPESHYQAQGSYALSPYFFPTASEGYHEPCPAHAAPNPAFPTSSHQHIHAPIPISSYSSLLPNLTHDFSDGAFTSKAANNRPGSSYRAPPTPGHGGTPLASPSYPRPPSLTSEQSSENDSTSVDGSQSPATFPTPCELLVKLSEPSCLPARTRQRSTPVPPPVQTSPPPQSTGRSRPVNANIRRPRSSTLLSSSSHQDRPENIRKSYFRTVQEHVGFKLTDPDTITSHEKKRHYLEALEQYVIWLHQQLSVVGHAPLPLERIDRYDRGLTSRSIRTMLVHYQDDARRVYRDLKQKDPQHPLFDEVTAQS